MHSALSPWLRRSPTVFLQIVVILIGSGILSFMIREPRVEGVNAHRSTFEIYCKDPFIAFAYISSLAIFTGLWQVFRLLGCARVGLIISPAAVRSLRIIKYCGIALIGCVIVGEIMIFSHDSDDRAGGVFMGVLISFLSAVVATAAGTFEGILQNAVTLKSENDLTV